jgi:antitoxin component HigA of HigAB toxin-antitoxin module
MGSAVGISGLQAGEDVKPMSGSTSPIDVPDPIEAIKFRLEQKGTDYRSLVGVIGQRTRVYTKLCAGTDPYR